MQEVARQALKNNLRDHDKRQGYRGVTAVLSEPEQEEFLAGQAEQFTDEPLTEGQFSQA